MKEDKRKKFVEFDNAVDNMISEILGDISKEDVKEYYGNHPLGKVVIGHINTREKLRERLEKK